MTISYNKKNIINCIIVYFLVVLSTGVLRINLIFNTIKVDVNKATKISSYFSLAIGAIIVATIIYTIIYISNSFNELYSEKIEYPIFVKGTLFFLTTLICGEMAKLVYVFSSLKDLLIKHGSDTSILEIILNSQFKSYSDTTDYVVYFFCGLTFFVATYNNKLKLSIMISTLITLLLVLVKYFIG